MTAWKFKRILFAEDSENDVELTLEALDEYKLANSVDVVQDGEEALDYLLRRGKYKDRPDENPVVILLDLKMPKLDGLDVLKKIKEHEKLKNIPVVILTSSKLEEDIIRSYNLGANGYVVKPVDFIEFVEAIKKIGAYWVLSNEPPPLSKFMK